MDTSKLNATLTALNKTIADMSKTLASINNKEKEEKYANKEHSENPTNKTDKTVNKSAKNFSDKLDGVGSSMHKFSQAARDLADSTRTSAKSTQKTTSDMQGAWDGIRKSLYESFSDEGRRNKKMDATMDAVSKSLESSSASLSAGIKKHLDRFYDMQDNGPGYQRNVKNMIRHSEEMNQEFQKLIKVMQNVASAGTATESDIKTMNTALRILKNNNIDLTDELEMVNINLEDFKKGLRANSGNLDVMASDIIKFNKVVNKSGEKFVQSVSTFTAALDSKVGGNLENKMYEVGTKLADGVKKALVGVIGEISGKLVGWSTGFMRTGATDMNFVGHQFTAAAFGMDVVELANVAAKNSDMLRHFGKTSSAIEAIRSKDFDDVYDSIQDATGLYGAENMEFASKAMQTLTNVGISHTKELLMESGKSARTFASLTDMIPSEVNDMFNEMHKNGAYQALMMSRKAENRTIEASTKQLKLLAGTVYGTSEGFKQFQLNMAERSRDPAVQRLVQAKVAGRMAEDLGMSAEEIAIIEKQRANPMSIQTPEDIAAFGQAWAKFTSLGQKAYSDAQVGEELVPQVNLETFAGLVGDMSIIWDAGQRSGDESGLHETRMNNVNEVVATAEKGFGRFVKGLNQLSEIMEGLKKSAPGGALSTLGSLAVGSIGSAITTIGMHKYLNRGNKPDKVPKTKKPMKMRGWKGMLLGGMLTFAGGAFASGKGPEEGPDGYEPDGYEPDGGGIGGLGTAIGTVATGGILGREFKNRKMTKLAPTSNVGKIFKRLPLLAGLFGAVDGIDEAEGGTLGGGGLVDSMARGSVKGLLGSVTGLMDGVLNIAGVDSDITGVGDKIIDTGADGIGGIGTWLGNFVGRMVHGPIPDGGPMTYTIPKNSMNINKIDETNHATAFDDAIAHEEKMKAINKTNNLNSVYGDEVSIKPISVTQHEKDIKLYSEQSIILLTEISEKLGVVAVIGQDGNVLNKNAIEEQKARDAANYTQSDRNKRLNDVMTAVPLQ